MIIKLHAVTEAVLPRDWPYFNNRLTKSRIFTVAVLTIERCL